MSSGPLTLLLHDAQQKIAQHLFADALRTIREAKIIDLHNVYLSALEQYLSAVPRTQSPSDSSPRSRQIASSFVERAMVDHERRMIKRNERYAAPDRRTLEQEKMKNQYFQRTDDMLEKKAYERALEEVRRIYFFEPSNIVAQEYEQKILQMIELNNINE